MATRAGTDYAANGKFTAECVLCLEMRTEWDVGVGGCNCRPVCRACFDQAETRHRYSGLPCVKCQRHCPPVEGVVPDCARGCRGATHILYLDPLS